jgi:hypothetical protein
MKEMKMLVTAILTSKMKVKEKGLSMTRDLIAALRSFSKIKLV